MGATGSGTKTIKGKLILLIMIISGLALVLSLGLLVTNDIFTARRAMVVEMNSLARLIGVGATTALEFESDEHANDVIVALRAKPNIICAGIYNADGGLLAGYKRMDMQEVALPAKPEPTGHTFADQRLHLYHQLFVNKEPIGAIYLQSDMNRLRDRLRQYMLIAAGILFVSTGIVYLLASRLQRLISDPILDLANTARQVSETRDYTVRVRREANDETGYLVERFNEILAQIEAHERQLRDVNEQLAV